MVAWRITLWVALLVSAVLFLYLVRGILLPFIVSFILAALLEPAVRKLRLRGMSRGPAVGLVMGAFLITIVGVGFLVAPGISRQVVNLTDKVESLTRTISQDNNNDNYFLRWNPVVQTQQGAATSQVDKLFERYGGYLERIGLPSNRRAFMDQYVEKQRPKIAQAVQAGFNSFFGILTNLFSQLLFVVIVPILVPLILMEMETFRRRGPRWIPPSIRANTVSVVSDISQVFVKYLRGVSTVVLLFTVAQTLVLLFFGVPYAILLGVIFGAMYLIPYIGNVFSCVILFSLLGFSDVSGNWLFSLPSAWTYATLVTLVFLAVGFTFDHLIYPSMVGNSVGLNPVVSMFVIFCGGALFGLPGMLIAFPLAGSVKIVLDRLLRVTSSGGDEVQLPAVPLRHRPAA